MKSSIDNEKTITASDLGLSKLSSVEDDSEIVKVSIVNGSLNIKGMKSGTATFTVQDELSGEVEVTATVSNTGSITTNYTKYVNPIIDAKLTTSGDTIIITFSDAIKLDSNFVATFDTVSINSDEATLSQDEKQLTIKLPQNTTVASSGIITVVGVKYDNSTRTFKFRLDDFKNL